MFQQFLQLDLQVPHNKQLYSLKKNEVVFKALQKSVKFDAICYNADDIMSKLTYQIVTGTMGSEKHSITATFNYNIEAKDLVLLMSKLSSVKNYKEFKLGHFEIKNGHISDYHKNKTSRDTGFIDDLDQFQKEMDVSLELDRLWKINHVLSYRELTRENFNAEVGRVNKKFGKRTNEFYVLEIDSRIQVILILLPRNRDLVLTWEEEKEIEELFILQKHANNLHRKNICFVTPIAKIIKNYLQGATINFFVSCFPQLEKSLEQVLKLPLRMSHPHEEQIRKILEQYNKDTQVELERELQKSKRKLKETELLVKSEEENIKALTKIYTKMFSKTQPKIEFLKERGVLNISKHIEWLKGQLKEKETEIGEEQDELKQIHMDIILEQKRHLFYMNKVRQHKENVETKQSSPSMTPNLSSSKTTTTYEDKQNQGVTEELMLYFYDPQKEMAKYREKKEQEVKIKLDASQEKQQFMKLYEQARKKLGSEELAMFEQEYFTYIHP